MTKFATLILVILCLNSCSISSNNITKKDLEENPEFHEAISLEKTYNYEGALDIYKNLYKTYSNSYELKIKIADCYRLIGRCDKAQSFYKSLLRNNDHPEYLNALESSGMCLVQQGQYKKAIKTLSEIFEIDAFRWKTINALGVSYALESNAEESKKYFEIALSLEENEYIIYNNLALTSAFLGNYKSAISYQKQALKMINTNDNNFKRIDLNLALLYGMDGKMEYAKKILVKHLNKDEVISNLEYYKSLHKDSNASKKLMQESLESINTDRIKKIK